jgi:drug/metabolite transporter (DMT)-like permease
MDRAESNIVSPRTRLLWHGALVIAAFFWGVAFVPQRMAMRYTGPFTFNAIRFAGGGLLVSAIAGRRRMRENDARDRRAMLLLGSLLFSGAALQQVGMVSASASEGGFITGLYIVLVPLLLSLVWRERIAWNCWTGALAALVGLGMLTLTGEFTLASGDAWILACAFAFALHVIAVGKYAGHSDALVLAAGQYGVCAGLNFILAAALERDTWPGTPQAFPELAYMVVCSIGIAYTLQVLAQRYVPAANAAIVLSLESAFAALAGRVVLSELLTPRQLWGGALMFTGMVLAQIHELKAEARRLSPPDNR